MGLVSDDDKYASLTTAKLRSAASSPSYYALADLWAMRGEAEDVTIHN